MDYLAVQCVLYNVNSLIYIQRQIEGVGYLRTKRSQKPTAHRTVDNFLHFLKQVLVTLMVLTITNLDSFCKVVTALISVFLDIGLFEHFFQ